MRHVAVFVGLLLACSTPSVELSGRLCGPGNTCGSGFDCNPVNQLCGPSVDVNCVGGICPEEVNSTTACSDPYAFIPCISGVSDCSQGCRICEDGTWSECTSNSGDSIEVCDGQDNDGDSIIDNDGALGCLTYYVDVDGDGRGVTADSRCICGPSGQYRATEGDDCDDSNPNAWVSCATCVDADLDSAFAGCDAYVTISEDCDDSDAYEFDDCATPCVDVDDDNFYVGCDRYDARRGEDCNDAVENVWESCDRCVDVDGDERYVNCDGPDLDCDDDNRYEFDNCGGCVDLDEDGFFSGCDAYDNQRIEDCDDNPESCGGLCFPGATEWCNDTDNNCAGDGADGCTVMVDPIHLSSIDVCRSAADLTITEDVTFNTDTGEITFENDGDFFVPANQDVFDQSSGAYDIRVLFVRSFVVEPGIRFVAEGINALAIVACDEILIDGILDANARRRVSGPGGFNGEQNGQPDTNYGPGAGGRGQTVGVTNVDGAGSGGGGAGHCGAGGDGGAAIQQSSLNVTAGGGAGGQPYSNGSVFMGGSGGGSGVPFRDGARFGGGGGGAVNLVAGHRVVVNGRIEANGAGGGIDDLVFTSGSGAGSGGSILVEAPLVVVASDGDLSADGGGGAAGQTGGVSVDTKTRGQSGAPGQSRANGGSAVGGETAGDGGDGNSGSVPNGEAGFFSVYDGRDRSRAGGGGGGAGVIRLKARARVVNSVDLSPNSSTFCTTEGDIEVRGVER